MSYSLTTFFIFYFLATGCLFVQAAHQSQAPRQYSKADIEQIYNELRQSSFDDISEKSRLVFKKMKIFGMSSPVSLRIYINIDKINKYQWPEDAVTGLLAHELSHMVSYQRRSRLGGMFYLWNYSFSIAREKKVEREADEIAIERGYGKELVQERIYQFKGEDTRNIKKQNKIYYHPEDLEGMIDSMKSIRHMNKNE